MLHSNKPLLGGCPASSIDKLQVVQNAAAYQVKKIWSYYPKFTVSALATY